MRTGIVAIYDTHHPEYRDTPGCLDDYPWVVAAWEGIYVPPSGPQTYGHYIMPERKLRHARKTCDLLNYFSANGKDDPR
jgi:hypothetical protein